MLKNIFKISTCNFCNNKLSRRFLSAELPLAEQNDKINCSNKPTGIATQGTNWKSDYFNIHDMFTVKDLFEAKVHLGHKEVSLDERMKQFVFGSRLGHVIFDLDVTAFHLREALNFCAHIAHRDGIILFISQNKRCTLLVENTAKECQEYASARNWRPGTFTDAVNVFGCETRLPDLCIFLNTLDECGNQHPAVVEAAKLLIPSIGVVDSDCNPNLITYPVPGNDDSPSSVSLFCKLFKEAILRSKKKKQTAKATK